MKDEKFKSTVLKGHIDWLASGSVSADGTVVVSRRSIEALCVRNIKDG